MSRVAVWFLVSSVILVALAAAPTAQATHEWGHRYMLYGRVLDSDGDPAQRQALRITVETTKAQDPYMTVRTDCHGLYYSFKDPANPGEDFGLEGGVMHIHHWELPSDSTWSVQSDAGGKTGKVRAEMHRSTVNLELDSAVPAAGECDGVADWTTTYVVQGRVQEIDGSSRLDKMSVGGLEFNVTVTIDTADGRKTGHGNTNRFGDYMVAFDNISVEDGDKITASWGGHSESTTANTKYRVSEANIIYGGGLASGAAKTLLWIVGGIVVVGAAVWGFGKLRHQMETARLEKTSGRKRANR